MWQSIISTGLLFFIFLFGLMWYMEHIDIDSLTDILHAGFIPDNKGLDPYELSLFFTTFVFLQFWNMFNARAFATGCSALHMKGCGGFIAIAGAIFAGQILIIEIGGQFFNVVPLKLTDWVIIITTTSSVLWIGELIRLFHSKKHNRFIIY